ncbi:unnamed protein product [Closterium sp. NIES-65]|nr:unnamed protein product [Closterium sp. NIES-65]
MPRQSKKGAQQAAKAGNVERNPAAKGHQSEPATPKPMLKEVEGPFADDVRISLVKKLTTLKFPPTASSAGRGEDSAAEEKDEATEVTPPAVDPVAPVVGEEEEEEEDDGYLSDDPEVLLPAWLSKKQYGRLQVTFLQASDANYVWCRRIEHKMLDEKKIFLDWQHPENPTYTHKRATNPDSIEVLLKSVLAAITPEMVYEYLVKTVLEKRGRTSFLSGDAFHRVVDPVTGADTDKIRGLVKGHPGDKASMASTRIDRGLISFSLVGLLADARHVKVPRGLSDHWFGIKFALAVAEPDDRGLGMWRMQARQAQRRGVSVVTARILQRIGAEKIDIGKKLRLLSVGLRDYSREERKRVKATVTHLERVVEFLRHKVMRYPRDKRVQSKLVRKEAHLEAYLQSCKDRMQVLAVIKVELDGEVPSLYLLAKIKAAADHFRAAFKEVPPEEAVDWENFSEGAKFSVADAASLGAEWTEAEVKEGLEGLPKGKSPGQDGLPAEFFILHWELLMEHVRGFVREFVEMAKMPEGISTAVTVLLHKEGDTDQLGNYRPITLLTVMYKRVTKIMATRLKRVLSKEQHGFLPGKSLADVVSVVADAVEAPNGGSKDWLLLLVDFKKAYNTVSRDFLFRVMSELGIPERFVRWTRGLHEEAGMRVIINGWLSEKVEMHRGVRQGCPLAPYLFLCALEPLCREMQRRRLGVGPEGKTPLSYVGYADDTSILLRGEGQLQEVVEVLDMFGKQSGLKVNCDKSVVVPLGCNRGTATPQGMPYKWSEREEPERLLGIWITPNGDAGPSWKKAHERIKEELRKWEAQYLTTTARVAVISCYVLPVLMFQAQVYSPPYEVWEKIRKLGHAFVSAGEVAEEKIFILWSAYLACLPRKDGGLGQIDPKLCLDGLAVRRVGKLLREPDATRRWLAEEAAGFPQGWATLYAHPSPIKQWQQGSERWKAAVKVFLKSPFASLPSPASRWEVEEEFIWVSREVKGEEELAVEQGCKEAAIMARKAYEAIPPEWKKMVEEPTTVAAVVAASGVARYVLRGQPTGPLWAMKGIDGAQIVAEYMATDAEGKLYVPGGRRETCFEACSLQPLAVRGGRVLGTVGDPKARILGKLGLFAGGELVPLRRLRAMLSKSTGHSWRQAEWEEDWGKKIDWKRAIDTRDSVSVPLKARDVLLRVHSMNLQVGGRLDFFQNRIACPHFGGEETLAHCLYSCPTIQPVIDALKRSLQMMNPGKPMDSLGDLLYEHGGTKSGFPEMTLTAAILGRIWLARCDAVWRATPFDRKKVERCAVLDFMTHARVVVV